MFIRTPSSFTVALSWVTESSAHSRFTRSRYSSKRLTRCPLGTANASNSVSRYPSPTPKTKFPRAMTSSEATVSAVYTGLWRLRSRIPSPVVISPASGMSRVRKGTIWSCWLLPSLR